MKMQDLLEFLFRSQKNASNRQETSDNIKKRTKNYQLIILMQIDSTASQSLQLQDQLNSTSYLINTSKAVKGHKLTTKDFMRLQLLKFKHISPKKQHRIVTQQSVFPSKSIQYQKFKPFDTIQEEEIHLIIANQRQQMSRETKGKIKLFNNAKINSIFTDTNDHIYANTLEVRTKPMSSQQPREIKKKQPYSKSATEQFRTTTVSLKQKNKSSNLIFRSQNFGKRMNRILNDFIKDVKHPKQQQRKEQQQSQVTESQPSTFCVSNLPFRKKNNITFMRQMKKHRKVKLQEKGSQCFSRVKTEQATQQVTYELTYREKTAQLQNRANQTFNSYSVELRKRGTTVDFRNCFVKRQYQQSDSIFN